MASTAAAIRDRIRSLIEALTPTSDAGVKFRSYRNEGSADFVDWAEKNPAAALRRFQARDNGSEDPPEVSNADTDMRHVTYAILIAYPHTARHGADQALDRDDVMHEDFKKIEQAIGIYGRANFSSTHDCTPLGNEGAPMKEIERGNACDFLRITARFSYYATVGV